MKKLRLFVLFLAVLILFSACRMLPSKDYVKPISVSPSQKEIVELYQALGVEAAFFEFHVEKYNNLRLGLDIYRSGVRDEDNLYLEVIGNDIFDTKRHALAASFDRENNLWRFAIKSDSTNASLQFARDDDLSSMGTFAYEFMGQEKNIVLGEDIVLGYFAFYNGNHPISANLLEVISENPENTADIPLLYVVKCVFT